jgi:DNA-binding CsgD family transcriptional regulator/tetratricopeptide (TPR) repeat protein
VLRDAFAQAADGRGGVVFITGEPGIGKSRLVRELTAHAREYGALTATGRAVPAGSGTPYRPLTEALLQLLRDRPLTAHADLDPWLPALRAILPALGQPDQAAAAEPLTAAGLASPVASAEAVIQLLRWLSACTGTGLVIALEDLHWADPDTLTLLEYLADNLGGERVLCVATSRDQPETAAALARRLAGRRAAGHLPLDRLDPDEVEHMVRACAAGADDELVLRAQRAADGVPFLVEEVLASPGVPASFAETVRARLAEFSPEERRVLEAAALLGRGFDWQLLAAAAAVPDRTVTESLERAVTTQLVTVDGEVFRFRHALTREAVIDGQLPPRRRELAAAALAAVDAAHPVLDGPWRDVAADLAARAGDTARAGALLTASGEAALDRGALATAAATLRRAAELLTDPAARASAEGLLVGCLALAGNADEALRLGERLIADSTITASAADLHIQLARAAIAATRWPVARAHVEAARRLDAAAPPDATRRALIDVLAAELALAGDDLGQAGQLAEAALETAAASPEVRCQALEIIGRIARLRDLTAARDAFERALAIAEAEHLPVWRLRALQELGTIDLLDHGGTELLGRARRTAAEIGAFATAAELDLQLAACADFRFEFGETARHARRALAAAERLDMTDARAKALMFLAEAHGMRQELADMEKCLRQAESLAPENRFITAFGWGGCRAMAALARADLPAALAAFARGAVIMRTLPQAEPAMFRALWPLALAAAADPRAAAELAGTRRGNVTVARFNRGVLGYADAVLTGRRGARDQATALSATATADVGDSTLGHLSRLLAAGPALASGWGEPARWLAGAHEDFTAKGFTELAIWCQELLSGPSTGRLGALGVTPREAEILGLIAAGLANKDIAARLYLSPRTVEKHVESLLRKTGATSRTMLVAITGPWPQTPQALEARPARARPVT